MKKYNVVHVGVSEVSGSPQSISDALNIYTDYNSTFINIGWLLQAPIMPNDELTNRSIDNIVTCLKSADVIHLHQAVPLVFAGLNLLSSDFSHVMIVRQWHSEVGHFKRWGFPDVDEFLDEPFNHLVLTQYHERYYPWAIPVPNLINTEQLSLIPVTWPEKPTLVFSPSHRYRVTDRRWASKGVEELLERLAPLVKKGLLDIDLVENQPYSEVLKRKAAATFVVDEVVTGSYHRSGLEGLALGKPTFAWLDPRTSSSLALTTGSNDNPFINCSINDIELVLRYFLSNRQLIKEVGDFSKNWMRKYYLDSILIKKYTDIYDALLNSSEVPTRNKAFSTGGEEFIRSGLIDLLHRKNIK